MNPKMLNIKLNDIHLYGRHGVSSSEQAVGSHFIINVSMDVICTSAALINDELEGTVNYAEAYACIKDTFAIPSRLLENVVHRMAQALIKRFPSITAVSITVEKLNPPMSADCRSASVTLRLER